MATKDGLMLCNVKATTHAPFLSPSCLCSFKREGKMERVWYQNEGLSVPVRSWASFEGNLSETDFSVRVQVSQRAILSVCGVLRFYSVLCCFYPTLK